MVAEEIRRLADSSNQATKRVAERIEAMLNETDTVRQAMENALREVREGRTLSEQARQSLLQVSRLVEGSVNVALQISGASREQAQVTQTVSDSMQTIANVTTESAAGARETSKAVKDLVDLSERLISAISRFTVDSRGERPGRESPQA